MTYPPPPGPPGADGWPGGDPNQMPPTDPYGAGVPGGYPPPPQPDPYGAPASGIPGPDPYGAPASGIPASGMPGSDPYASNPYSAPPGYGPPQPGMPGMPGPGMPGMPGVPQPAPSSGNTGWIVGGVIGVVVILLGVVGVLFATGAFDSKPDSSDSAASDSDSDKTDDGKDDDKETEPGASESGEYKLVEKLCDSVDLSGFTKYADLDGEPTQSNTNNDGYSYTSCNGYVGDILGEYGTFSLTVSIYESPADAEGDYEFNTDYMTKCDSTDEAKGSWAQGTMMTSGKDNMDCYIGIDESNTGLFVQDGNLSMHLTFGLNGKLPDGKEGDVLTNVAEELLAVCAA